MYDVISTADELVRFFNKTHFLAWAEDFTPSGFRYLFTPQILLWEIECPVTIEWQRMQSVCDRTWFVMTFLISSTCSPSSLISDRKILGRAFECLGKFVHYPHLLGSNICIRSRRCPTNHGIDPHMFDIVIVSQQIGWAWFLQTGFQTWFLQYSYFATSRL